MKKKYLVYSFLAALFFFSIWYFTNALSHKVRLQEVIHKSKQVADDGGKDKTSGGKFNYTDITAKSIFHPDRVFAEKKDPKPEEIKQEVVPPPVMPRFGLEGIVQAPDGEYIAYISQDGEKPRPVHVGDRFEGVKVVNITLTDVSIKWNNTDMNLSLSKIKSIGRER